jgi:hypothetical protein
MDELRKITVEVPVSDLEQAQAYTGAGVTETVRAGLKRPGVVHAERELRKLRGKVKFNADLMKLREDED